jgi:hypothetical protein
VSGHTKGRVIADGTTVYIDGGIQVHIAYCHDGDGDPLTDVGEANAKRIALVWNCHDELLAALDRLLNCVDGNHTHDWLRRCKEQARAAIAKATQP